MNENKATALLCFTGVGIIMVLLLVDAVYICPNKASGVDMTQDEALYQYCLIETELKYPLSAPEVIERLCELEQIGRNMAG